MNQLPLAIRLSTSATFSNFVVGENQELIDVLRQADVFEPIYLWGGRGSGRTHLLQALCREGAAKGESVFYLPLAAVTDRLTPDVLDGMTHTRWLCLDDLEGIAGDRLWEEALFGLYNALREARCQLVVTARTPPAELPLALADLRSRLAWGLTYRLQPPDEAAKRRILKERAQARGLHLGDEVIAYLMHRWQRDIGSLLALLDDLDQASWINKRALTLPFVRDCLNRMEQREEGL